MVCGRWYAEKHRYRFVSLKCLLMSATLSLIISLQAEHIGPTKYLLYNFYLLYTGTVYICQFRVALITNNNQNQIKIKFPPTAGTLTLTYE